MKMPEPEQQRGGENSAAATPLHSSASKKTPRKMTSSQNALITEKVAQVITTPPSLETGRTSA
jgi:hypothetical protein